MMTRKAQPGSTTPGGTILSDFRNYGNVKVSPDHEHESPFDKLMALSIVEGRARTTITGIKVVLLSEQAKLGAP